MNKPVACVYQQFGIGRVAWLAEVPPDGTPLYTHPVKELTDSEITEVFDKCFPTNASSDVIPLVEFARAILRKAGE